MSNRVDFTRPCEICGTPFRPIKQALAKGYGRRCSRTCANIARRPPMPTFDDVTDIEAAYMAGLLDGEGCIHFRSTGRTINIRIAMTDRDVLEWCQEKFGGWLLTVKVPEGRKPQWCWGCGSIHVAGVLTKIIPYLRVKRQQAEAAIDFIKGQETARWPKAKAL